MLQTSRAGLLSTAALAGLVLAGCAETKLVVHTAKQIQKIEPARPQGAYKIGEPYLINGAWYYPAEDYRYNETGIASYYGGEQSGVNFHGRMTANGEIYDMNALTAAHQTLPMPSLVRVTNLENGRQIVLRVNDRGPFARGRILDVSRRTAQLLGFDAQGTARVRVEILAEESRALKAALVPGTPAGPARPQVEVVAAAPREAVASDALPPPPGARAAGPVASTPLPPPSQTLPPAAAQAAPGRGGRPAANHSQTVARPAAPVFTQPAPSTPTAAPAAPVATKEVAALPVIQHLRALQIVTQTAVRPTGIFVQAGAFANYDAAYRLSARLSRYGRAQVTPVAVGGQQLYRVRVGPVDSVAEADGLLEHVALVVPEARIVVD